MNLTFEGDPALPPLEKTADDDGVFSDAVHFLPEDPPGEYRLSATGEACIAEVTISWMPDTATGSAVPDENPPWQLIIVASAGLTASIAAFRLNPPRRKPVGR